MAESETVNVNENDNGLLTALFYEIINSPLNIGLILLIGLLVYKIFKNHQNVPQHQPEPELPKMKKKDFTLAELKQYDGNGKDGRILVAVNGNVYDVTKARQFYGPGGPYAAFGGHDASRGLATFSISTNKEDEYDDLSDLNSMEMDSVREWEAQFKEKYDLVGRLLAPGQQPTNYSDEEDEVTAGSGDKEKDD